MTGKEFCSRWEQLQQVHDDFVGLEAEKQTLAEEVASNPLNDEEVKTAVSDVLKSADSITDELTLRMTKLYPEWNSNAEYTTGDRVQYAGTLYRCLQSHTAQDSWKPIDATSLWANVLIPNHDIIPEWEQPESTNPYSAGDKVTHNGKTWISALDGNVWEPSVYGWSEAPEEEV